MKQQEVFKKIGGILKELNDQYEYLKPGAGEVNELELELFLANAHFLTDHVLILSKLNAQSQPKTVEKPGPASEQRYFEPLVQPFTDNTADEGSATDKHPTGNGANPSAQSINESGGDESSYLFNEHEPETIRHELILDEADWEDEDDPYENAETAGDDIEGAEPRHAVKQQIHAAAKEEEKPLEFTPDESIKAEHKPGIVTINEKISAQLTEKNSGTAANINNQAISDLKLAITLNDKLLFIKELFNGYSLAYSEAIEILNRFGSFDEADLFLKKNYVSKNNWESKPVTTAKLYELLKRRYA